MSGIIYKNGQWLMLCGSGQVVINYVDKNDKPIRPPEPGTAAGDQKDGQHERGTGQRSGTAHVRSAASR